VLAAAEQQQRQRIEAECQGSQQEYKAAQATLKQQQREQRWWEEL